MKPEALGLAMAAFLSCAAAHAADKPVYAPPGDWVKPVPIPDKPANADGAASQLLLQDVQYRFGPQGDETYQDIAVKILAPEGLSTVGNLIVPWNPDTATLTIHRLNIIRDGKVIDLLDGGKAVTVLRRETNLEKAMLDGALTATIQPAGLQVGDVVDFAYTELSRDPVLQDHAIAFTQLVRPGVVSRLYIRASWPTSRPVQWRETEGMPKAVTAQDGQYQTLLIDQTDIEAPKPPARAPARFNNLAQLELSQFKDWSDISALMAPLYAKASTLAPASPLTAEIQTIAAASKDPKTRAAMALRLVEEKVRYVLLAMNSGGYVPADADLTWTRRFGDCKAKTTLLLALLKGLGVEAEPVLVNTSGGDGLDQHLPLLAFDHVLVRAHIDGKTYWLDGTRDGDVNLDNLPIPPYHWVLPVTAAGAKLEPLVQPPYTRPHLESVVRLDARAGLDAPAPAHAENIYRGDEGLRLHLLLSRGSRSDVEDALRRYWRKKIPWVDPKTVNVAYDEATTTTTLAMDGTATIDWSKNGAARDFVAYDTSLGYTANFDREDGPNRDAPYAVAYPAFIKATVVVQLPNKGAGFALLSTGKDQTVAGVQYVRTGRLTADGTATLTASSRSLQPEFPATEAKAAAATLKTLADYTGAIRAGASPVERAITQCFDGDDSLAVPGCTAYLGQPGLSKTDMYQAYMKRSVAHARQLAFGPAADDLNRAIALQPDSADAYRRRADTEWRLARLDPAQRDFDKALQLQPTLAAVLIDQSRFYRAQKKLDLAVNDMDALVKLEPDNTQWLRERGSLHAAQGACEQAVADAAHADSLGPDDSDVHIASGWIYARCMDPDKAKAEFQRAVDLLKNDSDTSAGALNNQCWARAVADTDLDTALADCESAVKQDPQSAAMIDSRAFVHFRMGQMKEALADYDQALKLDSKETSSLFMRGVVKHRLGDKAGGDADVAAALAIDPNAASDFADVSISP